MSKEMTFTATGDSFITRRLPSKDSCSFKDIATLIQKSEVRFTNLEVTVHNFEGYPAAESGGTWAVSPPEVLEDLKAYGFNLINWANNHTMDYTYGGLEETEKNLNNYGFVHAGAGRNLAEASRPKYLDCPSGRVALIGVTSTFQKFARAGDQRRDLKGRPGVNPLRVETFYGLTEKRIMQLKEIANTLGIHVDEEQEVFEFEGLKILKTNHEGKITKIFEMDLQRILDSISEAKQLADYVIVSIHSHDISTRTNLTPYFLREFAKTCIDHGAHTIIGHGPHILEGIEIYKGKPIFYSLGNFIFQNETVKTLPHDFYEQFNLTHTHNVAEAFNARKKVFDFGKYPFFWESIIPSWTMKNGELLKLELYPIELGHEFPRYERGWPKLSNNLSILEKIQQLSLPFGTQIEIGGKKGMVKLKG